MKDKFCNQMYHHLCQFLVVHFRSRQSRLSHSPFKVFDIHGCFFSLQFHLVLECLMEF